VKGWIREILFLVGVGFLAACTFDYYRDVWHLPQLGLWSIVVVALACVVVGRKGRGNPR
jgi:hypothetical protein